MSPKKTEAQQSIETLAERYSALHEKKIQSETNLKNAEDRLREIKEKARREYGTDDLEELRAKLEQMKKENEQKRATYQADLDRIEEDLAKVEKKFGELSAAPERP